MSRPQPLNLAAEIRSHRRLTAWRSARLRAARLREHLDIAEHGRDRAVEAAEQLQARVRELEAERALYVGVEPTIAEEKAELSRRLDAVDAVVAQWNEHCIGTQTRFLLDDVRAAANGETQPTA